MILKKMIDICKKEKYIRVFEDAESGAKWLSGESIAGAMETEVELGAEEILYFMDIPETAAESMNVINEPAPLTLPSITSYDSPLERLQYSLNCKGTTLQPFVSEKGVLFADMSRLSVFSDVDNKKYYLSKWNNTYCILIYSGVWMAGLVMTVIINVPEMIYFSDKLNETVKQAKRNKFCCAGAEKIDLLDGLEE